MLIIDGAEASDYKVCKNVKKIKHLGTYGQVDNTPRGMETGSLSCIMNILGVPKENIPNGRAYLETVSEDIETHNDDLIFRCNNVTIENNKLISSCGNYKAGGIKESDIKGCKLVHMGAYKNLFIMKNAKRYIDSIITYPPHQNIPALPLCHRPKYRKEERSAAILRRTGGLSVRATWQPFSPAFFPA